MKPQNSPWTRLVAAARQAPADERDAAAPLGFATRVAALGVGAMEPAFSAVFARVSMRALGVCAVLMVAGVALNWSPVLNAVESEPVATISDPVAEWLSASAS